MTQRVEVRYGSGSGGYAYDWRGKDSLEVGDEVLVAGPYWAGAGSTQKATVTKATSDYKGGAASIIRKVAK